MLKLLPADIIHYIFIICSITDKRSLIRTCHTFYEYSKLMSKIEKEFWKMISKKKFYSEYYFIDTLHKFTIELMYDGYPILNKYYVPNNKIIYGCGSRRIRHKSEFSIFKKFDIVDLIVVVIHFIVAICLLCIAIMVNKFKTFDIVYLIVVVIYFIVAICLLCIAIMVNKFKTFDIVDLIVLVIHFIVAICLSCIAIMVNKF